MNKPVSRAGRLRRFAKLMIGAATASSSTGGGLYDER